MSSFTGPAWSMRFRSMIATSAPSRPSATAMRSTHPLGALLGRTFRALGGPRMPTSPVRVAVWSTGGIGSIAIGAVTRRPDLELVGVWVHSPDKEGRDAGELAGGEPIGL